MPTTFECRALLFDLDGTLVDSLPAVDRAWSKWAAKHQMDADAVISKIHGRRSIDSVRLLRPELDAEAEDAWIREMEEADTEGVVALPGTLAFMARLMPTDFAIVTSGTTGVAHARLRAVGLDTPLNGVYGEDVERGKPNPAPYLLAAERLELSPADCLVFEDTAAGIRSAKSAGMRAIGIATWVDPQELGEADAVASDFTHLEVDRNGDRLVVRVGV